MEISLTLKNATPAYHSTGLHICLPRVHTPSSIYPFCFPRYLFHDGGYLKPVGRAVYLSQYHAQLAKRSLDLTSGVTHIVV